MDDNPANLDHELEADGLSEGEVANNVMDDADTADDEAKAGAAVSAAPQEADEPAAAVADEDAAPVALVTGGAGSAGLAAAMELARRGWRIMLQHNASPAAAGKAVDTILAAAQAAGKHVDVLDVQVDLGVGHEREQLVEQALECYGRIDLLVNAAIAPAADGDDLLEITPSRLESQMDAVLNSAFFLTQRVASEMVRLVESGQIENPRIVTINSINAYTSSLDSPAQCLAQSALAMMTKLFADRLGEYGINVYEIRAGIIAAAADGSHAKYDSLIAQGLTPIRRWGRPGDIARAVAAIAEDLLGFSTGEVINVDGGFHVRRL